MAWARWLFPVPGGPRKSASSRCAMKRPVASSWISARFIFLLKSKSKRIERAVRIAEARLFVPALEQAVLSAQELVGHEHRHEIDRRELLGLGVAQSGFEDGRHAGQAELAERAIELDEIHSGSPVLRSMRSR